MIARPHHYFAFFRGSNLAALVPTGYQDLNLAAPHGTALVGWADPNQPQDSETVQATLPASASPQARLLALAATLRNTPGVALSYRGPVNILFPGGLVVPELEYTTHLGPTAVFAFDACTHTIAVTVTISDTSRHGARQPLGGASAVGERAVQRTGVQQPGPGRRRDPADAAELIRRRRSAPARR